MTGDLCLFLYLFLVHRWDFFAKPDAQAVIYSDFFCVVFVSGSRVLRSAFF